MARLFLAAWLVAFGFQSTDLLALVAPDTCTEDVQGSAADPCPEGCPRCLCCARVPIFVPQIVASPAADVLVTAVPLGAIDGPANAFSHRIFHVPKTL